MRTRMLSRATRYGRPGLWLAGGAIATLWMILYAAAVWELTTNNPLLR